MPLVVKSPGLSTNPDAPTFAAIANTKGVTRTALFAMLQTSHKEMPNLVIKGDDAQNIIAYILRARTRIFESRNGEGIPSVTQRE